MLLVLLACAPAATKDSTVGDSSAEPSCPTAAFSPESLSWPDVPLGVPQTGTVSLANECTDGSALSVIATVDPGPFTLSGSPLSLPPGGVGTLQVTYTPAD